MHRWPSWLRWVVLIPFTIIGAFVGAFILKVILEVCPYTQDRQWIIDCGQSGALGGLLIFLTVTIAPKYKNNLAIIILVLLGTMQLLFILFAASGSVGKYNFLVSIPIFVIAISTYYQLRDEIDFD